MEAFAGEDPPENEVPNFKGAATDVAAVIAAQPLLVPGCADGSLAPSYFKESQVFSSQIVLECFVKGAHSQGAMLELCGEHCFCTVDEEEGRLACWLRCSCAYRP